MVDVSKETYEINGVEKVVDMEWLVVVDCCG